MNWIITDHNGRVISTSPTAVQLLNNHVPSNIRELCEDCPVNGRANQLFKKILNIGGLHYKPMSYEDDGRPRILWQTVDTDSITRLERLLSDERNFFDLIFNNVDSDIAIFDQHHRYRYVNRMGIADDQLRSWIIGKDDFDYCSYRNVPASQAFARRKRFEEAVKQAKTIKWKDHYLREGREQFVERILHPIFIDDKVKYVVGIGRDVTDYELLNRELRGSKERYERLFYENISGLFKSDLSGEFIEMNNAFAAIFGYEVNELMQMPAEVLYPSKTTREKYLADLEVTGILTNYTMYLRNKNGDEVIVLANIRLTRRDEPGGGTIQGALIDVTEERKAYKTINWLSSLAKESPDPIVRLDGITGEVLFMNIAAEDAFEGLDYELVLRGMFEEALTNSGEKSEQTMEIGDHWFVVRCAKIKSDNPYINFYFSDVTDEQMMIKELDRSISELNQRNENLKQFNFIVSHNLRAPISNLNGLTSLAKVKFGQLPDGLDEIFSHIASSSAKLDQVIIDLNHLLEVQSINQTAELFSVANCISEVISILEPEIQNAQATINVQVPEETDFYSIQSFVHSILHNLISNSLKYRDGSRKAVIEVIAGFQNNTLTLTVNDNGIGFDASNNDVFQPFKRQHHHVEGKGLGLSIVKAQVDQLKGKIHIHSNEETGSTFHVSIPAWK